MNSYKKSNFTIILAIAMILGSYPQIALGWRRSLLQQPQVVQPAPVGVQPIAPVVPTLPPLRKFVPSPIIPKKEVPKKKPPKKLIRVEKATEIQARMAEIINSLTQLRIDDNYINEQILPTLEEYLQRKYQFLMEKVAPKNLESLEAAIQAYRRGAREPENPITVGLIESIKNAFVTLKGHIEGLAYKQERLWEKLKALKHKIKPIKEIIAVAKHWHDLKIDPDASERDKIIAKERYDRAFARHAKKLKELITTSLPHLETLISTRSTLQERDDALTAARNIRQKATHLMRYLDIPGVEAGNLGTQWIEYKDTGNEKVNGIRDALYCFSILRRGPPANIILTRDQVQRIDLTRLKRGLLFLYKEFQREGVNTFGLFLDHVSQHHSSNVERVLRRFILDPTIFIENEDLSRNYITRTYSQARTENLPQRLLNIRNTINNLLGEMRINLRDQGNFLQNNLLARIIEQNRLVEQNAAETIRLITDYQQNFRYITRTMRVNLNERALENRRRIGRIAADIRNLANQATGIVRLARAQQEQLQQEEEERQAAVHEARLRAAEEEEAQTEELARLEGLVERRRLELARQRQELANLQARQRQEAEEGARARQQMGQLEARVVRLGQEAARQEEQIRLARERVRRELEQQVVKMRQQQKQEITQLRAGEKALEEQLLISAQRKLLLNSIEPQELRERAELTQENIQILIRNLNLLNITISAIFNLAGEMDKFYPLKEVTLQQLHAKLDQINNNLMPVLNTPVDSPLIPSIRVVFNSATETLRLGIQSLLKFHRPLREGSYPWHYGTNIKRLNEILKHLTGKFNFGPIDVHYPKLPPKKGRLVRRRRRRRPPLEIQQQRID